MDSAVLSQMIKKCFREMQLPFYQHSVSRWIEHVTHKDFKWSKKILSFVGSTEHNKKIYLHEQAVSIKIELFFSSLFRSSCKTYIENILFIYLSRMFYIILYRECYSEPRYSFASTTKTTKKTIENFMLHIVCCNHITRIYFNANGF